MRHGWRSLENYLDIHDKVIRSYHPHMNPVKVYELRWFTSQWLQLSCCPIFLTTYRGTLVRVDIKIDVEVDDSTSRRQARTFDYTFSASLPGKTTLIRYCSPHPDPQTAAAPGHHAHHHRHDFTSGNQIITLLDAQSRPFVGEFIEEVMHTF